MIEEDYVSFETAKLLKEKGFDAVKCQNSPHFAYNKDGQFSGPSWDTEYVAPTLQMAMKWLRKEHKLHIEIRITNHSLSSMFDLPKYYWVVFNSEKVKWVGESNLSDVKDFDTAEEACEAAIKYCLEKLI